MIEAKKISKKYGEIMILDNFSTSIANGDFVSIIGESGSGKTTLINLLGLLEDVSSGDIIVNSKINPNKRDSMLLRRYNFGYIFQNYALIENDTVGNNLKVALEYRKRIDKKYEISNALDYVSLGGFEDKKVYELSGGEQQRVAIARVILKKSEYIFADEPTGNLDRKNRDLVFGLMKRLNDEGRAIIYVTHDLELANCANRQIVL